MDAISANDMGGLISRLPEKDKLELQQFIKNETQKSNIQSTIHSMTDMCFKKCITSKISSGKLDRYEEPCMTNCVERFLDGTNLILKHMDTMRGA